MVLLTHNKYAISAHRKNLVRSTVLDKFIADEAKSEADIAHIIGKRTPFQQKVCWEGFSKQKK
jgi:hypothetical protein